MILPTNGPFDLEATLNSGQVFHWSRHTFEGRRGYIGCIGDVPTFLAQPAPDQVFATQKGLVNDSTGSSQELGRDDCPQSSTKPTGQQQDRRGRLGTGRPYLSVQSYLGLHESDAEMRATFPQDDSFFEAALNFSPGLRILQQPTWECLATFITSSLKQVAHIRGISMQLREKFGECHEFLGETIYSYPTPDAFVEAGEQALRGCALGYRAKSLHLTARAIADGTINLEDVLEIESHADARDFLCQFHGVGEKIANCTLLFGCGRLDAFPIDVWIERVLRKGYRKRVKGEKLQHWAESYFGPYAGYAQQFLFHYARVGKIGES